MNGLEITAIVLIAVLSWYVVLMLISIILMKANQPTAARWCKILSFLNYPFHLLDKHSFHTQSEDEKYGVRFARSANRARVNAAKGISSWFQNQADKAAAKADEWERKSPQSQQPQQVVTERTEETVKLEDLPLDEQAKIKSELPEPRPAPAQAESTVMAGADVF